MCALVAALGLVGAPVYGASPSEAPAEAKAAAAAKSGRDVYIARFEAEPAITFKGDARRGLARTAPGPGGKLRTNSRAVRAYVAVLRDAHAQALRRAGASPRDQLLYSYTYSLNGLAARLTAAEAARLTRQPGVLTVERQFMAQPTTDNTPEFLGITERQGGLWSRLGGRWRAGRGMIVGIIDTGIWPEHPSFSDRRFPRRRAGASNPVVMPDPPDYWTGACEGGERFSPGDCNNKLIGARWFAEGFYGFPPTAATSEDYASPRDHDGHGSHVAGTAAGRERVTAEVLGNEIGAIAGMAPRAHVAAYKVCWDESGCAGADLVAAIDQAVADGVDVINYSIGSNTPALLSPDAVAFLFARDAGVFVATSAGNAGPGPGTVGSPASAPWLTSVGASTHSRDFRNRVVLEDGRRFTGVSITQGTDLRPIVDAEDFGNALCVPGEFDDPRGRVDGKIVLCARGQIARVEKSLAVQQAGGVGMVLHNTAPHDTRNTDNHYVPSSHVGAQAGQRLKDYIDQPGRQRARITRGRAVRVAGNDMAAFSSRGPNGASGDVLSPDVTAPGVNVLAANTPTPFLGSPGELFQSISGTSMSSPHVAGIATLLMQRHRDWTPAMLQSALVTTGRRNIDKEDGRTPADPFDFGGGHIAPQRADRPGLTYEADFSDYLQFLQGTGTIDLGLEGIDPSDLNRPSIAIGELAGEQTVTREVTSVGPRGEYRAVVKAPPGVQVTVDPPFFQVRNRTPVRYQVTFTVTEDAALGEYAFGKLTWVNDAAKLRVRSPIAVRPVQLAAPDEVHGTGASGSLSYDITFGYSGEFKAAPRGLVAADETAGSVEDDPNNAFNPAGPGVTTHDVEVPAGSEHVRFALFDDAVDGEHDLDLYVFRGDQFVGFSAGGTSEEQVDVDAPEPGTYTVYVHGWQTENEETANYTLFTWQLTSAAAGNMTVDAPTQAELGETAEVTVTWNGLSGGRWMGAVTYHDSAPATAWRDDLIGRTLVRVDVGEGRDAP